MKNSLATILLAVLLAAGLGVGYYGGITMTPAMTTTFTAAPRTTTVTTGAAVNAPKFASVTVLITRGEGGGLLGPDGLHHDTMYPENLTVFVGEKVNITFINFDEGPHTFTSPDLGVNFAISGAVNASAGIPSVTHDVLTAAKPGVFFWYCAILCDGGGNHWAMTKGPHGELTQPGYMGGYVTILSA